MIENKKSIDKKNDGVVIVKVISNIVVEAQALARLRVHDIKIRRNE